MDQSVRKLIRSIEADVIAWRRWLHQHPEISFEEFETTAFILERLKAFGGFEISRPAKTGVVAALDTKKPGRTIALRADIDALPIREDNALPYKSMRDGVMHACGHDGHTAILLGTACTLSKISEDLAGRILLIFQHAEEQPPGGAIELYKAGVMEGVDEIYGLHLSSAYPSGVFGIRPGVLTAATDEFRVEITGKGGHSSMPEKCIDPVVIGASLISSIQSIVSRSISASERAVISVCTLRAGSAYNIIPDTLHLSGSVRTFSPNVRETIRKRLSDLASHTAEAYGGRASLEYFYGYDSVVNDPALAEAAEAAVIDLFGRDAVMPIDMIYPGEDFSYLQKDCKGIFVEAGTADPLIGTDRPHHNPLYRMDESVLIACVEYLVGMVLSRMHGCGT